MLRVPVRITGAVVRVNKHTRFSTLSCMCVTLIMIYDLASIKIPEERGSFYGVVERIMPVWGDRERCKTESMLFREWDVRRVLLASR